VIEGFHFIFGLELCLDSDGALRVFAIESLFWRRLMFFAGFTLFYSLPEQL